MLNSDDPYYRGGARCGACDYLYFPDLPGTWNSAAWITDFECKKEIVLEEQYAGADDWRRDVYLVLHFLDCTEKMVTWYFESPEFDEHERLLGILKSLGASKSVDTLQRVIRLAIRPEEVLERIGHIVTSEQVDEAWEEVSFELSQSMDKNLRRLVYDRFMRDHDVAEF